MKEIQSESQIPNLIPVISTKFADGSTANKDPFLILQTNLILKFIPQLCKKCEKSLKILHIQDEIGSIKTEFYFATSTRSNNPIKPCSGKKAMLN